MIQTLATLFNQGGSFMWVILTILAMAAAVIVDRLVFYFFVCRKNPISASLQIVKALQAKENDKARAISASSGSPAHALLDVAVDRFVNGATAIEIEDSIGEAAINEMPRLNQRLNYLSLFANIATLLGLLGTISGLQRSFASMAAVEASKKASMLAAGIAEAMNATAFGLLVAVLCMVTYTFLYNKQQMISRTTDEAVVRFMNFVKRHASA